jgi:hypothetical protein
VDHGRRDDRPDGGADGAGDFAVGAWGSGVSGEEFSVTSFQ